MLNTDVLGTYEQDFYKGMPAVTENNFGKGKAYYVAFRNDGNFADIFCKKLARDTEITPDCDITADDGVLIRKRGEHIFVMNFSDNKVKINLNGEYKNTVSGEMLTGETELDVCGYLVLE